MTGGGRTTGESKLTLLETRNRSVTTTETTGTTPHGLFDPSPNFSVHKPGAHSYFNYAYRDDCRLALGAVDTSVLAGY
jgi:hypothetical protein